MSIVCLRPSQLVRSAQAVGLGLLIVVARAMAAENSTELAPVVDRALGESEIVSAEELESGRRGLVVALRRVLGSLEREPSGEYVGRIMQLHELEHRLADEQPDLAALRLIERAWSPQLLVRTPVPMDAVATAMRAYVALLAAAKDTDRGDRCRDQLDRLLAAWNAYRDRQASFDEVREHYAWLAAHRAASPVRAWLQERASHPNLSIEVSKSFCQSLLPASVEQRVTIDENDDGTRLAGRGQMHGTFELTLEPNDRQAVASINFVGQGHTNVVAHRGSAKVDARCSLSLRASQRVLLDDTFRLAGPPTIDVHVGSEPLSASLAVRTPLFRQIGSRAALTVARRKHEAGDHAAEEKLREQLEADFRERTQALLAGLAAAKQIVMQQLSTAGMSVGISARSTTDALQVGLCLASDRQLAAPEPPPSGDLPQRSLRLTAHESLVNNYGALLGGETIGEQDFRAKVFETFALVPMPNPAERGSGLPTFLTLADDPVRVRFVDDCVALTLRIASFTTGDGRTIAGPWIVHARYHVMTTDAGVEVQRQGNVAVEPRGDIAVELAKLLPHYLVDRACSNGISMLGEFGAAMNLKTTNVTIDRGWASIVVER
ncbi:MAG TPA: hypothetical protein VG713_13740 [Pirellulales bacterium]|nr:hypothetical protein [Pirellulales bacterium]